MGYQYKSWFELGHCQIVDLDSNVFPSELQINIKFLGYRTECLGTILGDVSIM